MARLRVRCEVVFAPAGGAGAPPSAGGERIALSRAERTASQHAHAAALLLRERWPGLHVRVSPVGKGAGAAK